MEGKKIFIPVKTYNSSVNSTSKQSKQSKQSKEKNGSSNGAAFSLEGFVQVEYKYLVHLHSSWVKYTCNGNFYTGGFIVECDFTTSVKTIKLRVPAKSELINVEINKEMSFYIKKDTTNYISLLTFIDDLDKLQHSQNRISSILNRVKNIKNYFYNDTLNLKFKRCGRLVSKEEFFDNLFGIDESGNAIWGNSVYCCSKKCN